MARYAMVHAASGYVVNVIMWSGDEADWRPPPGHIMVLDDPPSAGAGCTWDGATFIPPPAGLPGTAAVAQEEPQETPE